MGGSNLDELFEELFEAGTPNEIDFQALGNASDPSDSAGSNNSHTSRSTTRTSPPEPHGPRTSEARATESPAFMSTPMLNQNPQCWQSFVEVWRRVCRAAMTSAPKALPLGLAAKRFPLGHCSKAFPSSLMLVCKDFYDVAMEVFYGENEWTFYARPSGFFVSGFFTSSPLTEVMPYMKNVEVAFDFLGCLYDKPPAISDLSVTALRDNVVEICNVLEMAIEIKELRLTWRETTLYSNDFLITACGLNPATGQIGGPLQEAMAKTFQPLLLLPSLPPPMSCKNDSGINIDMLCVIFLDGTRLRCVEEAFSRNVEYLSRARENRYPESGTTEQEQSKQWLAWGSISREVLAKRAGILAATEGRERAARVRAAEEDRIAQEERAREEAERYRRELKEHNDKKWRRRLAANHAGHKMGWGLCTPECKVFENLRSYNIHVTPQEAAPTGLMDRHDWPGPSLMDHATLNQSPYMAGSVFHQPQQAESTAVNHTSGSSMAFMDARWSQ